MTRSLLITALLGLAALAAGATAGHLAAERASRDLTTAGDTLVDGWVFPENVGSIKATPLVRARVARSGTLGLDPREAVYLATDMDADGNTLDAACTYTIRGGTFDTRWWSVAVYNDDNLYILTEPKRASWNSENITRAPDGSWQIVLSPTAQPGNWIPTSNATGVELLLRLYNPSPALREALPNIDLPTITREAC